MAGTGRGRDLSEEVAKEISVVKGNRISLEYYYSSCCPDEVFRQIYRDMSNLSGETKLDFDDMILYCYDLFVQRKDILAHGRINFSISWSMSFRISISFSMICTDAGETAGQSFYVGDDDQSIYHFRGQDRRSC